MKHGESGPYVLRGRLIDGENKDRETRERETQECDRRCDATARHNDHDDASLQHEMSMQDDNTTMRDNGPKRQRYTLLPQPHIIIIIIILVYRLVPPPPYQISSSHRHSVSRRDHQTTALPL
ncbi:hypothetical protein BDN70DRAFT_363049 [Pholiota conissans]|uniref:Uncharacterized protein n=1 Tax=Pholiota conissans TaxID=109636 RepID=A0A9P5YPT0_9AGAR|nr:hypothetical protein BDN70DRAFT_363049 [Pholiota conissans]